MAKVKILGRIGEFDETYLPNLEAIVEKAGRTFLRLRIIPNSEHWLEYHFRFRNRVKGAESLLGMSCNLTRSWSRDTRRRMKGELQKDKNCCPRLSLSQQFGPTKSVAQVPAQRWSIFGGRVFYLARSPGTHRDL